MFNCILAAFKFTTASQLALKRAIALARSQQAELHIFNALDYADTGLKKQSPKSRELIAAAEHQFEAEIAPMITGVPKFAFHCFPADPGVAICKQAAEIDADLIVLGAHQAPGMSLGRLDYVAMTVFEKAPCAVMLVPYISTEPVNPKLDFQI
ncbi:MAG: universal stress protein [Desulfobacteraceae bacterium]|nr:universal stress protein [Desulfobacteraceae bacterium]